MDKDILSPESIYPLQETKTQHKFTPQSISNKFNSFFKNLLDMISKHKYRKTLTEIKKNEEEKFIDNPQAKKSLSIVKLKCYYLIIKKKYSKYQDITLANIQPWLKRMETELDLLSHSLHLMTNEKERNSASIEEFVFFYLLYLYNYAVYSKKLQLKNDTIFYLIIADNMIKSLSSHIAYPSTLHLIQLIYLLFSGIFIEQSYFSTAINYLSLVLTLGLKEIELRSIQDSNQLKATKIDITDDDLIPHVHNNFFTFTVAFLQLGICAESIGNYEQANNSYKQSSWFISFISNYTSGDLVSFIQDLTIRSKQTIDLLALLKSNDFHLNDAKEVKVIPKNHLDLLEEEKSKRYVHIQQYVEDLKLTEIDDDEANLLTEVGCQPSSDTVKQMTSTVKFINLLMSNKYKPLVSRINRLEINNLTKETKAKIQKKIINFKNTERLKLFESKAFSSNFSTSNANLTVSESNRTKDNINAFPQMKAEAALPITSLRYHNNINTNTTTNNTNASNKSRFNTLSSLSNPKPEKIQYDKFVFNKIYRNKINYLEYQNKKEYLFQKNLLKMKRYDTLPITLQDSERVISDCNKFYKKTLNNCVQKLKEKQEAIKINPTSLQKIKNTIALNFKKKKRDETMLIALLKNCPKIDKSKRIIGHMKQNQKMIDQLEFDIEMLGDREKKIHQKQK